jgi:RNA polymerase sigma-70 factor (ECF subfamily)
MQDPEAWVDQYGNLLYRFALTRVRDSEIAEDLVQETFLAALHSRKNFEGHSSLKTWFIAILKHKIVDYYRNKNREKATENFDHVSASVDAVFNDKGGWKVRPSKWQSNPMEIYNQKEFMEILHRCLADLPERLANAFVLRELDGFSTKEICKVLNITATNTWVMLYRARMHLRQCLEINWFGPADQRMSDD